MQIKYKKNGNESIIHVMAKESSKALLKVTARQPFLQRAMLALVLWGAGYITKADHTRPGDFPGKKKMENWLALAMGKFLEQEVWFEIKANRAEG